MHTRIANNLGVRNLAGPVQHEFQRDLGRRMGTHFHMTPLLVTLAHFGMQRGPFQRWSILLRPQKAPRFTRVVDLGIGYTHEKFEADLMARWQSSFLDVRAPEIPGPTLLVSVDNYVTFNARIAYRVLDNVTLALVAQQFNAPRLITTGGAPQERRLIASVTARF